jgi:epoxyqueuosine reductase
MILDSSFLSSLGVLDWGYTEESRPRSFEHFTSWVEQGHHGSLAYLSDHRKEAREDIKEVYPAFQSALVFLFDYRSTKKWLLENGHHEVAAYSLGFEGEDYHLALRKRLQKILEKLQETHPGLEASLSLDIQPILERDLAHRAGLGWFGKNSMLISRRDGSYFIIGSLLLNQKISVEPRAVDADHCGTCRACVDACPTDAIDPQTRTLKASQCISTYTIEVFRDSTAPLGMEASRGELFGCDICQDVCPWNKKPLERVLSLLSLQGKFEYLKDWFFTWSKDELKTYMAAQTNRGLKKLFQGTVFERPGREGWLKNFRPSRTALSETNTDVPSPSQVRDEEDV